MERWRGGGMEVWEVGGCTSVATQAPGPPPPFSGSPPPPPHCSSLCLLSDSDQGLYSLPGGGGVEKERRGERGRRRIDGEEE